MVGMMEAWERVELGEAFAFYTVPWTTQEEDLLSGLVVQRSMQLGCYATDRACLDRAVMAVYESLVPSGATQEDLAGLIMGRIDEVLRVTQASDAEVVLRLRESYDGGPCHTWHIDKTRHDSGIFLDPEDARTYAGAVFLLPLLGEPTVYRSTTAEVHARFHALANETAYYYGDGAFEDCDSLDALPVLWKSQPSDFAAPGGGSVHVMGWNGAIHSAPNRSEKGRMILMTIPIYDGVGSVEQIKGEATCWS